MPERNGEWFLEFSLMTPKEYGLGSFQETMHIKLKATTEKEAIEEGIAEWQKIKVAKLLNLTICPRVVYTIKIDI